MVKAGDRIKIVKNNHELEKMGFALGSEHIVNERNTDMGGHGLYVYLHDKAWFMLESASQGLTPWIGFVDLVPAVDNFTKQYGREKTSLCECGGHRAGFKDYTRQHYSWCPVYKE